MLSNWFAQITPLLLVGLNSSANLAATLTKLLGTSAWYAPGASVAFLVKSILNDEKRIIPCSVFLDGEYNQDDICIGVPCIIGKNGCEKIINLNLNDKEMVKFADSASAVRKMNLAL